MEIRLAVPPRRRRLARAAENLLENAASAYSRRRDGPQRVILANPRFPNRRT